MMIYLVRNKQMLTLIKVKIDPGKIGPDDLQVGEYIALEDEVIVTEQVYTKNYEFLAPWPMTVIFRGIVK